MSRRSSRPETQRAALTMLARGHSPGEIAELAGASRQLIERWAMSARIDWRRIRVTRLADEWRRVLEARPAELLSKAKLRKIAARAKAKWDNDRAKAPHAS